MKIRCITTGEIFNTFKEAAEKYNISCSTICLCCNDGSKLCMPEDWSGSILYCESALSMFRVLLIYSLLIFPTKSLQTKVGRKPHRFLPTRFFIFKFFIMSQTFFIISSSFSIYGASVTLTVTVTFFAASDRFCISKVAAAFAGNDPVGKSFAFWSA